MLSQNLNNITCDWLPQSCSDQLVKIQRPNIWLYNCINECAIRIVCNNQITTPLITMTGLLALGQDCVIQYKDATIYSHNVFSSKTNIAMSLEIPTIDSPNDMWNTLKNTKFFLPKLNLSVEHRLLDYQITAQKDRESLPSNLSVHDIGNYAISTLLVGAIAVAIVVWRVRRYLSACKKSNTPITKETSTKPRQRTRKREENIELEEMAGHAEIDDGYGKINPRPQPAIATKFKL
ncbi:unnamed protein product [Arctia plantaginis]|nr:unnamed protein product [Arctia plantaginis]